MGRVDEWQVGRVGRVVGYTGSVHAENVVFSRVIKLTSVNLFKAPSTFGLETRLSGIITLY